MTRIDVSAKSYISLHAWIRSNYGSADRCENRDCPDTSQLFEWANLSHEYRKDRADFARLCKSCHGRYDRGSLVLNLDGPEPPRGSDTTKLLSGYDWFDDCLSNITPYSKAYYSVKRAVEKWGNWKDRPRGKAMEKGFDPRRNQVGKS